MRIWRIYIRVVLRGRGRFRDESCDRICEAFRVDWAALHWVGVVKWVGGNEVMLVELWR